MLLIIKTFTSTNISLLIAFGGFTSKIIDANGHPENNFEDVESEFAGFAMQIQFNDVYTSNIESL